MARNSLDGALLATGSLLALIVGMQGSAQAAACSRDNVSPPIDNVTPSDCITFHGGGAFGGGNVVNDSTLNVTAAEGGPLPGTASGISVLQTGTTLNANIINNGTINSNFADINIGNGNFGIPPTTAGAGGTLNGSITNNGTLGSNGHAAGITVAGTGSTVTGTITNGVNGTITSDDNGIAITGGAHVGGSIINDGKINVVSAVHGIEINTGATITGDVINSGTGTITTVGSAAMNIAGGSSVGGSITNAGTLTATHFGIFLSGSSAGAINNSGTINSGGYGIALSGGATSSTVTGNISNTGTINANGRDGIGLFSGSNVNGAVTNSKQITAARNGILVLNTSAVAGAATVSGGISNSGNITSTGTGFAGIAVVGGSVSNGITNTSTGSINNTNGAGILVGNQTPIRLAVTAGSVTGGISNQGTITAKTGIVVGGLSTVSGGITNTGNITGTAGTAIDLFSVGSGEGAATTINQNAGTITGNILLSALGDTVNVTGGAISGNIVGQSATGTVNFALGAGNMFTYTNSITGVSAVNVNSGTLFDNNSITATTVTVNGGTLAPGTPGTVGALSITGNLVFSTAATYLVMVTPAASSVTNVTGSVSLAGTVDAVFAPGSYVTKNYTILASTAPLVGHFAGLTTMNLPAGITASLAYTTDDVLLNLVANLGGGLTGGLNVNQQNVANALNNFFNSGGALPPGFFSVFGLTGANLGSALTQLSGEAATDSEKGAFQLMNEFLSLMLDPFVAGRSGSPGGGSALGFAPDQPASFPPDIALAYNSVLKAPPRPATFEGRWTAWGTAYGGYNKTDGDAAIGSNNVTVHTTGFAAGMDYHFTPDAVAGFALAGGGTNWGLAQGLGNGRSDAFQAGVYGTTRSGPWYVAAALAFTNNWMSTNRTALGDQLTAKFDGQSFGGRLEAGYRYVMPISGAVIGATPYAAVQAQSFHTPRFNETDVTGGGFGLNFNAMNATDTRSELGARFDDAIIVSNGMPLTLRARAAWAHDWVSNPFLGAVFQALPGASFVVNGAAAPKNSALSTAGAELHVTPAVSIAAKFDGEFAKGSQTYAGTGTVRYTW